ncbi:DUF6531 domain-containing protein [Embleya hyalina]|uniref:Type IV secretion protein Rhs n=1 Tax=Embleya hyalina TaxID=516124 RepID=A0A401YHP7_9ACTN|nr:DUF6531 domain-containing protein [Embleya hyalina]GCD94100.1 type IV secretion protein Rhs [Embleya hyalina]
MLVSGEPLTPDSQPRGLIPGDWEVLQALADVLTRFSAQALEAKGRLGKIEGRDLWQGDAAEGFRKDLGIVTEILGLHGKEYPSVAAKLREFAEVLRFAQGECANEIIPKAKQAFWLIEAQAREQESYDLAKRAQDVRKADGVGKECLPALPHKPEGHPGADMLREAQAQLQRVRERVEKADAHALLELRKSRGVLDLDPDMWKTLRQAGIDFAQGAAGGVFELASFAWTIDPGRIFVDPIAYATDLKGIAGGMLGIARDPVGFAQDTVVTSWEDFKKNPARWLGHAAPDLALTLATRGGNKALTPAQQVEKNIAKRDNPRCRAAEACTREGEPIDVVTGEMVLPQTDVTLAGALPLVLERHHRTAFGGGRFFGTRWASTLDQCVRLGADRVTFTAADGMTLRYPVPRPGEAVLPMGGYRWPLVWDGTGTFTVTDPRRGWTWSFAALPGPASRRIPVRALADRNGNRVDYHYDAEGVPREVTHSGGYRVAVDSAEGLITGYRLLGADPLTHTSTADPAASVDLVTFTHDAPGNLTEVVNSSGRPLRFTYDAHHRMTSWTDRNNTWYQYEYDGAGRCVRGSGINGVLDNTFAYDEASRITRMTDALGAVRTYEYNDWSQVIRETDPLGGTRLTEWDSYNRRVAVTDELGHTTRYSYDAWDNTIGVVLPNGTFTVADHDPLLCRPTRITAPDGEVRQHTYDSRGNLLTTTDELGATTSHTYNESGHLTSITNALGHTTTLTPNPAGLPIAVTDPLNATTHITHNAFGRTTTLTDPLGHTTKTTWTVEGKPALRERPDGTNESWTWDGEGNLRHHVNPAGFTTSYESTHFDLPAVRTGPDGARLEFTYDAELRLTEVTNPQGHTWRYTYDPAGRLAAETDFNGRGLTYHYDAAGRLIRHRNGAGEITTYTRDATGWVTSQRHVATQHETNYHFDAAGRLIRAIAPEADLVLTYDALGRITAETTNGRTLSNVYDAAGNRVRRTTPAGHVTEWTYDPTGRPTALHIVGNTLEFTFDPAGRETIRRFGDRVTLAQEWNETNHVISQAICVGDPAGRIAASLDPNLGVTERSRRNYTYRADGYVTSIDEPAIGLKTYDLNEVGRITAVHAHGWTERYAYDPAGNQRHADWPESEGAGGGREVVGTLIHRAGRIHYRYDDQGRMIQRTQKTLSGKSKYWIYTWGPEDRLASVVTPDGATWQYIYDPLARRIAKRKLTTGGTVATEVLFSWDNSFLAEQGSPGGATITWEYEFGDNHRPLLQINTSAGEEGEDSHCLAVACALDGTPVELVDNKGAIAWHSRHTLWGTRIATTPGDLDCPLGFPGQYRDLESQVFHSVFRQYDPNLAQFCSPDPLGIEASPNHHAYVINPVSWSDPLGLAPQGAKDPINLGPGFTARIDVFPMGLGTDFEIHVYKGGVDYGVYGSTGWFAKHGHGTDIEVPAAIENSLRGMAIEMLRRTNRLGPRGTEDISGDNWHRPRLTGGGCK